MKELYAGSQLAVPGELAHDTWAHQLLDVLWQFLQGLLELLQLAWAAVRGSSGLGVEAKKNDDLGQRGGHRRPPKRRGGGGGSHIPVMVVGGPAAGKAPGAAHVQHGGKHGGGKAHWHHHHHHPQGRQAQGAGGPGASPFKGLAGLAPGDGNAAGAGAMSPRQLGRTGSGVGQQQQQAALASAGGLLQHAATAGGVLSPRHTLQHLPSHPHSAAAVHHQQQQGGALGRPGSAVPNLRHASPLVGAAAGSSGGVLLRHQSLPTASALQQQQQQQQQGEEAQAQQGGGRAAIGLGGAAAALAELLASPRLRPAGQAPLPLPNCPSIDYNELELELPHVGEGGFARVYRARWRGHEVAVKLLNPETCAKPSVLEEFRREVAVLASLGSHPNIVRLVGACTAPPHLAVVTQYCRGGSLYALLHSPHVQLGWGALVEICLGAARGMAFLHACGVLHRDLKSGNLLLDADGSVKLADFGLSRMAQQAGPMTGGLGTYQWMAPEVLGHQRYSEKADVYSFAMVMWECAARQVPYTGLDGVQAALAVMNRGLRPEIPPHTPGPFARLMQACWAPTPDQRPDFVFVVGALESMQQEVEQQAVRERERQQQQQPAPHDNRQSQQPCQEAPVRQQQNEEQLGSEAAAAPAAADSEQAPSPGRATVCDAV